MPATALLTFDALRPSTKPYSFEENWDSGGEALCLETLRDLTARRREALEATSSSVRNSEERLTSCLAYVELLRRLVAEVSSHFPLAPRLRAANAISARLTDYRCTITSCSRENPRRRASCGRGTPGSCGRRLCPLLQTPATCAPSSCPYAASSRWRSLPTGTSCSGPRPTRCRRRRGKGSRCPPVRCMPARLPRHQPGASDLSTAHLGAEPEHAARAPATPSPPLSRPSPLRRGVSGAPLAEAGRCRGAPARGQRPPAPLRGGVPVPSGARSTHCCRGAGESWAASGKERKRELRRRQPQQRELRRRLCRDPLCRRSFSLRSLRT